MTFNIIEYKKSILNMFHELTEMEIKASLDACKDKPEYAHYSDLHNSAIQRCRELLKIILEGNNNE